MYVVKEYLTDKVVAIVTRKEDAVAMTKTSIPGEPRLIYKKQ